MKEKALPEGWVKSKLGDYLYLKNGYAFKKTKYSDKSENSYPIIRISDIDGSLASDKNSIHTLEKADGFELQKGDLLIAMSGATTGKMGVYQGNLPAYQNQRVGNLKLRGEGDEQFRNYLMLHLQKEIEILAYGNAQPNISGKMIEDLDVYLPPLPQQQILAKKFTALLSQVAEIKQRLEKIPALLKTYRQSVLARAVNGELSAKWREENGVSLESWNKAKIHNLGSIFSGKTPSKKNPSYWENGTVYWVSAKDMKFDEITFSSDLITEKAVNETKLKICPTDTILMVMRSGIIAHTFPVALTKVEVTINQDLKALRPKKDFAQPKFIFYLLKGNEQKILEKCSKAGTTVASIEMPEFEKFVFDIPSLEEQTHITQAVEKHLNFANQLEAQVNAALERVNLMTQAILAKGFRGELISSPDKL